ncbi:hypothetical protein CLIB1423_06S02322 [[Candida] railenensis]|uniref:Uncharacterized protein n=1 Tax=[Candida] railenensis TaxID=45579 RepID=A0A9P0QN16_9ASCO|nr:hypothetical protein CLIB1423_06S02322 [[Candida] railenensis]
MASIIKDKILNSNEPKIDYEELESKFQMHKYYPKYFHNYDYSTPVIKDLIANKPIYSNANQHVKTCKISSKPKDASKSGDLEKGDSSAFPADAKSTKRAIKKDYKDEKRELRKEKKEIRNEIKHEQREHFHDLRQERKEHHHENRQQKKELRRDYKNAKRELRKSGKPGEFGYFKCWNQPLADPIPMRRNDGRYPEEISTNITNSKPPAFNNPWDSSSTLVPNESAATKASTRSRNNSITSKFKSLLKTDHHDGDHNNSDTSPSKTTVSKRDVGGHQLKPSSSYDQTKSTMTKSRTKSLLNKLKVGDRRMSEQIGMYTKPMCERLYHSYHFNFFIL